MNDSMTKEVDSKPIYNEQFLKTKIKPYGDDAADFHDQETKASRYIFWERNFDSVFFEEAMLINIYCGCWLGQLLF